MNCHCEKWYWNPETVPFELHGLLNILGEIFPLKPGSDHKHELQFVQLADSPAYEVISEVSYTSSGATIKYNSIGAAGRGVGSVLAGLSGRESTPFTMLGIMIDFSRNMVFTVPALKKVFQRLALLGYNTVFLYCEDTYELPDEPFFGMMRGRYTASEIRQLDSIAADLGIELIGCIQTLGHMAQPLRWTTEYINIRDTSSVMMIDAPETMQLVGKMLDFWQENLRSRRIHIGMDEAHDMGRGRFLDKNGYENGFELFNRHLNKVMQECRRRGLQPMIWEDMYFRLGNPEQNYHVLNSPIPPEVRKNMPPDVQLVYWDYYNTEQDFYEKFIDLHQAMDIQPLMGAGVWIWSRLWYDHKLSSVNNRACVAACRKKGIKELFFTIWGDDGAICHFDSVWCGLTEAAELAFGHDDFAQTAARYQALTGSDYALNLIPSQLTVKFNNTNTSLAILWDDLLLGMAWHNIKLENPQGIEIVINEYQNILEALNSHRNECGGGDLDYAWKTTKFLLDKLLIRQELIQAYSERDLSGLAELRDKKIPALVASFDDFTLHFRAQWLANAKPFGLETMQHRMGGQRERLLEAARRIDEFLAGKIDRIPELEAAYGNHPERMQIYSQIASPSVII